MTLGISIGELASNLTFTASSAHDILPRCTFVPGLWIQTGKKLLAAATCAGNCVRRLFLRKVCIRVAPARTCRTALHDPSLPASFRDNNAIVRSRQTGA